MALKANLILLNSVQFISITANYLRGFPEPQIIPSEIFTNEILHAELPNNLSDWYFFIK